VVGFEMADDALDGGSLPHLFLDRKRSSDPLLSRLI